MRIIAMGDLHGDSDAFLTVAQAFELVTPELAWKAEDVRFIQMGDICDRGAGSKKIYDLMIRWQEQAPAFGSNVSFLLGNHEAMNVFGFHAYVNPGDLAGYAAVPGSRGELEYIDAWGEDGWLYGWLSAQNALVREGPFMFGHGDLPVVHANTSWEDLDRMTMDAFRDSPKRLPPESLPPLLFSETQSVLWCRQAGAGDVNDYGRLLEEFLLGNDASVYVCGHTPSENGTFRILYGGRYLCIDTAMVFRSHGLGSVSAFVYEDGTARARRFADGTFEEVVLDIALPPAPGTSPAE